MCLCVPSLHYRAILKPQSRRRRLQAGSLVHSAAAAAVGELTVAWAAEIAPDIAALADMAALRVFGAKDVVVVAPTPPETVVVETLEYDAGRPVTTPAPATTAWKFRNWSLLCRLH